MRPINSIRILPLIFGLAAVGCSTSVITLESSPSKATVSVRSLSGGGLRKIGITPVTLTGDKIFDAVGGIVGPIYIEYQKEGYFPATTLVTDLTRADVKITRELFVDDRKNQKESPAAQPTGPNGPTPDQIAEQIKNAVNSAVKNEREKYYQEYEKFNHAVDDLFEAQRLVRVQRQEEALVVLRNLRNQTPDLSAIYEIEGGIYFLQKKYTDALDSYRLALKYNSKGIDALKMQIVLENLIGIKRVPAGTTTRE